MTDVKTIGERLKHARSAKGWTQGQLAAAAGLSQGTIGNIESEKRMARASLVPISRALGVRYDWLSDGIGLMHSDQASARLASENEAVYLVDNPDFPAVRRVTLRLQAGMTGFIVESDPEEVDPIVFRRAWFDSRGFNPQKLIAMRVKGASMEPALFDNDTVVINTAQTTPKDGAVFAINYEGEAVIKRMVRDAGQWSFQHTFPPNHSEHPEASMLQRTQHEKSHLC